MKNIIFLYQKLFIMFVILILPIFATADDDNINQILYEIYSFSDGLAKIFQNGKFGYIDKSGKIVIKPQFDDAHNFSDGLAVVKQNGKYGYIDKNGQFVIQPKFYHAYNFSDGLAITVQKDKYGYINKSGEIVIEPQFSYADNFSDGLAKVSLGRKYGYIDKSGKVVIKPQFAMAHSFSNGVARVWRNGRYGYIDKSGKVIIKPQFNYADNFSEDMAVIWQYNKYGYIDKSGRVVIQPQFDYAFHFSDGLARIYQNTKYGYIDRNGKMVIQPQFDDAHNFSDGLAMVRQNGKYRYIDKSGNMISTGIMTLNQYLQNNFTPIVSVSEYTKPRVEHDINAWQKKGEFESTSKWQERVNEKKRNIKISELTDKYKAEYAILLEEHKEKYKSICSQYYALIEKMKKQDFNVEQLKLSIYDADHESYMISFNGELADILLPVPVEEAPSFKQNWETIKKTVDLHYVPNGDDVALTSVTFTHNGKKYTYDGSTYVKYAITDVDYNFKPIELALNDNSNIDYTFDPLEGTESNVVQSIGGNKANVERKKMRIGNQSDVDIDIPVSSKNNDRIFAVIIGNENYQKVSKVLFAQNDASTFAMYCQKTLGLPEKNIRSYKDATYATMLSAVKDIQGIAKAYKGELNVIFYYAGHGIPNESSGDAFLLPVDADGRQTEVCYPLNRLYSELGSMEAHSVTVFMDACFSGSERGSNMLASARGVAIKAKAAAPSGKMVVFSAASGDETAYPYKEKSHGLFTYFLLKKLQETKGEVSLSELGNYIIDNVAKESIVSNGKSQTPTITPSLSVADTWQNMKLK